MPRLYKGGAKAEQTGCVRWMATPQPNCGHSGFHFLPIARGKECYPPHGEKKIESFPICWPTGTGCQTSPASQGPSPGKNYATSSPSLPSPWGPGSFSHGVSRQTAEVTVVSLALSPGDITAMLIRPETGTARSECRAGDSVPCSSQIRGSILRRIQTGKKVGVSPLASTRS